MANFIGAGRSNYFRVKDLAVFEAYCLQYGIGVYYEKENEQPVAIYSNEEDGAMPSQVFSDDDPESEEEIELHVFDDLSLMLEDNEVLIYECVGHEGLRYVNGWAFAINNRGERETVSLIDIYDKAKVLGNNITQAHY